jgi:hypothetical protein
MAHARHDAQLDEGEAGAASHTLRPTASHTLPIVPHTLAASEAGAGSSLLALSEAALSDAARGKVRGRPASRGRGQAGGGGGEAGGGEGRGRGRGGACSSAASTPKVCSASQHFGSQDSSKHSSKHSNKHSNSSGGSSKSTDTPLTNTAQGQGQAVASARPCAGAGSSGSSKGTGVVDAPQGGGGPSLGRGGGACSVTCEAGVDNGSGRLAAALSPARDGAHVCDIRILQ